MHKVSELKVWTKAIELTKGVYKLAKELPKDERFGLISQIKRSSVSVPSNIAEGAGRNSKKEFSHFLGIANGSAYELQTQLILIKELNLIEEHKVKPLLERVEEIQKMNYGFLKSLK